MKLFGNKALQQTSAVNPYLEAQAPHVVLALMESMGSNILELDNPKAMIFWGTAATLRIRLFI
ncbi:hypothetical protein [Aliamphritea spongicola]|nr:hypothetical protein [Aliamphritea spongicola]